MKRVLAMLLVLVFATGMLPLHTLATEFDDMGGMCEHFTTEYESTYNGFHMICCIDCGMFLYEESCEIFEGQCMFCGFIQYESCYHPEECLVYMTNNNGTHNVECRSCYMTVEWDVCCTYMPGESDGTENPGAPDDDWMMMSLRTVSSDSIHHCTYCGYETACKFEETGVVESNCAATVVGFACECGQSYTQTRPSQGHSVIKDIDSGYVTLQNSGSIPFTVTEGVYYSANHNSSSSSEFSVTAQKACALSMTYGVSSESNYDKFLIIHNGVQVDAISGEVANKTRVLTLAAGDKLIFRYTKDYSMSQGSDQGWVKLEIQAPAENEEASCSEAVVCVICGMVVKEKKPHTYTYTDNGNNTHKGICTDCKNTVNEAHSYEDGVCTACGNANGLRKEGDFTYMVIEDQVIIVDVDISVSGQVVVPPVLGGYPVTQIGDSAFRGCTHMTGVTIADSVIRIGDHAFDGCNSLVTIVIPDSVTHLGAYVFSNCTFLVNVTIGANVTEIGDGAFNNCEKLPEIVIPDSVDKIGDSAFDGCTDLKDVDIGDGVDEIGDYAFAGCDSLVTIVIPDSVTHLGVYVFSNCTFLINVTIGANVTEIGKGAFNNCGRLPAITIPDSVTKIGDSAFRDCTSLVTIVIPDSVTHLEVYAFYNCTFLTNVTIAGNLENVGENAFGNCNSLDKVYYGGTKEHLETVTEATGNTALLGADVRDNFKGHTYSQWDVVDESTHKRVCTECGLEEAVNHNWRAPQQIAPACTASGYTRHACADCTYSYKTDEVAAVGHQYAPDRVQAPSCTADGYTVYKCSNCGDSYTDDIVSMIAHDYADGVCNLCGDVEPAVTKWNVALTGDLQVNFCLNISSRVEDTARVRICVGDDVNTFPVSALEKTEDGLYVAPVSVAPAQINDNICVSVINNGNSSDTKVYTIRQYAYTILADSSHSGYHGLVREMLNYGAAAQLYFGHKTDDLANAGISGTGNVQIPNSAGDAVSIGGEIEGLSFYGASLLFCEKIAVRYYFKADGQINNMIFTVNGRPYVPQLKDGRYYIDVTDIMPQNLDQAVSVTVTDADGNTLSVGYNPMSYMVRMNTKGSETLKNLLKALYNYHLAAKAL